MTDRDATPPRARHASAVDATASTALIRSVLGTGVITAAADDLSYEQWSLTSDRITVLRLVSRGTRVRLAVDRPPQVLCVAVTGGRARLRRDHRSMDLAAGSCGLVAVDGDAVLEWADVSLQLVALPRSAFRIGSAAARAGRPPSQPLRPESRHLETVWTHLAAVTVQHLMAGDRSSDRSMLRDALVDALVEATVDAFDVAEVVLAPEAADDGLIARAERFMLPRLGDQLGLDDIAHGCGVSGRTLQLVYDRLAQENPAGHLRRLRMDAAARALSSAPDGTSVIAVARRFGYSSLARFGAHYRAAFGESPSVALKRRTLPPGRTGGVLTTD